MKKILILTVLLFFFQNSSAQSLCLYRDGFWGNWSEVGSSARFYGNYSGFMIYNSSVGQWDWGFKFQISGFSIPPKKARKQRIKNNQWYEYKGTVEYFISDDYPNYYAYVKGSTYPKFIAAESFTKQNGRPVKKIVVPATIKIAPYKDHPRVYNIYFQNVGIAISMGDTYFKQ